MSIIPVCLLSVQSKPCFPLPHLLLYPLLPQSLASHSFPFQMHSKTCPLFPLPKFKENLNYVAYIISLFVVFLHFENLKMLLQCISLSSRIGTIILLVGEMGVGKTGVGEMALTQLG